MTDWMGWVYDVTIPSEVSMITNEDFYNPSEEDPEYLDNVLVDICSRSIILFSNHGNQTDVTCETPKQFIETLTAIRDNVDEEDIYFKNPKVTNTSEV